MPRIRPDFRDDPDRPGRPPRPNAAIAADALLELVELLYEVLAGDRDAGDRRDPQPIRRYAVSSLELSVQHFGQHSAAR